MAKLVRVYDPDETERRINLILKEAVCPGLLEFMSELPYGMDTPLIRGIFYQWFIKHSIEGTLDEALNAVLSGPAGLISIGSQTTREQPNPRPRKRTHKQRTVTVKAGARQTTPGHQATPAVSHSTGVTESKPDEPALPVPDHLIESSHVESVAPSHQLPAAQATTASALSEADQQPLTVAQEVVDAGEHLPDADQVALLQTMGNLFP